MEFIRRRFLHLKKQAMVPSSSTPITAACSRRHHAHQPSRWYLPTLHRNFSFLFLQFLNPAIFLPNLAG
jgi:hypothetical protein